MSFFAFGVDIASLKIFLPKSCPGGEGGQGKAGKVVCLAYQTT